MRERHPRALAPFFGGHRHLLHERLLHGRVIDLPGRLHRRARELDRLLVVLRLQELLGLHHLRLGGRGVDPQAHGGITAGLADGLAGLGDLGLGLGGQPDVFAGQLFASGSGRRRPRAPVRARPPIGPAARTAPSRPGRARRPPPGNAGSPPAGLPDDCSGRRTRGSPRCGPARIPG